jgi:hypothetical protein
MDLQLTEEERAVLVKSINEYLARLRADIYKNRALETHSGLKRQEVLLMDMLKRLEAR